MPPRKPKSTPKQAPPDVVEAPVGVSGVPRPFSQLSEEEKIEAIRAAYPPITPEEAAANSARIFAETGVLNGAYVPPDTSPGLAMLAAQAFADFRHHIEEVALAGTPPDGAEILTPVTLATYFEAGVETPETVVLNEAQAVVNERMERPAILGIPVVEADLPDGSPFYLLNIKTGECAGSDGSYAPPTRAQPTTAQEANEALRAASGLPEGNLCLFCEQPIRPGEECCTTDASHPDANSGLLDDAVAPDAPPPVLAAAVEMFEVAMIETAKRMRRSRLGVEVPSEAAEHHAATVQAHNATNELRECGDPFASNYDAPVVEGPALAPPLDVWESDYERPVPADYAIAFLPDGTVTDGRDGPVPIEAEIRVWGELAVEERTRVSADLAARSAVKTKDREQARVALATETVLTNPAASLAIFRAVQSGKVKVAVWNSALLMPAVGAYPIGRTFRTPNAHGARFGNHDRPDDGTEAECRAWVEDQARAGGWAIVDEPKGRK